VLVRVLGPAAVTAGRDDAPADLGKRKVRTLLAALALHAPRPVRADRLAELLWPDGSRPASPEATIHTYVANLRSALRAVAGAAQLVATDDGYRLTEEATLDAAEFSAATVVARRAHAAGDDDTALEHLDAGLALWRGPAYADILEDPEAGVASRALEEQRLAAMELRTAIALDRGADAELVPDLELLVAAEPYRERLWHLLVVALYRAGRQADALAACARIRTILRDDLGVEPGPELRATERAVLDHEPWLQLRPHDGAPAPRAPLPARVRSLEDKPFVGRTTALGELQAWWDAAAPVAVVAGEGGIGKSRTCARFGAEVYAQGADVTWGTCTDVAVVPFPPVFEVLSRLDARSAFAKVAADVGADAGNALRALLDGTTPEAALAPAPTDAVARALLFRAAGAALRRDSDDRPLLVVVDDLHLADPATAVLLGALVGAPPSRTRWLVNVRPGEARADEVDALLTRWTSDGAPTVRLDGIQSADVAALAALAGVADDCLAADIHRATGGNPLFVTTLLHDVAAGLDVAASPSTVAAVRRRLERLDATTQDILRSASIIGATFSGAVVAAASGYDRRAVERAIDAALAAGIVEIAEDGHAYRFVHALVRDAIAATLAPARRAGEHRRVAEAVEEVHRDHLDDVAAELVHHYVAASADGDLRGAIEWGERAASHALRSYAHEEAGRVIALVLDALGDVGHEPARLRLLLLGAEAASRAGDVARSRSLALQAYDVAVRVGTTAQIVDSLHLRWEYGAESVRIEPLARAVLTQVDPDDHTTAAAAHSLLAVCITHRTPDTAAAEGEAALAHAAASGDAMLECVHIDNWMYVRWSYESVAVRRERAERLVVLSRASGALDLELLGHTWTLVAALEQGDIEAAFDAVASHARLARRLAMPRYLAGMHQKQAMLALFEGRFDDARRAADTTLATMGTEEFAAGWGAQMFAIHVERGTWEELDRLAAAVRAGDSTGRFAAALALLDARLGRTESAEVAFDRLVLDGALDRRDMYWLVTLAQLAETTRLLCDAARARLVLSVLGPAADRVVVIGAGVVCWGSAWRFVAPLHHILGDLPAAADAYERSLAMHEHMGGRPFVARDRIGLASVLAELDPTDARAGRLAAAGQRLAAHLGMRDVVAEADVLVAALDASSVGTGS
jgi:DNA-binding SARP family transcriptional activator